MKMINGTVPLIKERSQIFINYLYMNKDKYIRSESENCTLTQKIKKLLMLCIVILSLNTNVSAQKAKVVAIADKLTSVSLYDNDGWGGMPDMWRFQDKLNKVASNDELVILARNHRNGAARAVAFRLLVARGDSRYRNILYYSMNDTTSFLQQSFDVISSNNVANYMVNVLVDHWDYQSLSDSIYLDSLFRSQPKLMKKAKHLYKTFISRSTVRELRQIFTQKDSATLDSVIFFTPNLQHIGRLSWILQNLPAEERYYDRLHKMYYDEGYTEALPALCRYRRETDKTAVIECLLEFSKGLNKEHVIEGPEGRTNQGLKAVALWPDSAFLPTLLKVRDYEVSRTHYDYYRIRLFYLALMSYDDEISYNIIDETLRMAEKDKTTLKYHLEFFREAYDMNPRSRYEFFLRKYDNEINDLSL